MPQGQETPQVGITATGDEEERRCTAYKIHLSIVLFVGTYPGSIMLEDKQIQSGNDVSTTTSNSSINDPYL